MGIKKVKLNLVLESKGLYFLNAGKIALVVKVAFCRVRKQIPRVLYKYEGARGTSFRYLFNRTVYRGGLTGITIFDSPMLLKSVPRCSG